MGAASQSVFGSNGTLDVLATVANAGAVVTGGGSGATLEITNAGAVTLNSADTNLAVALAAGDTLTLSGNILLSEQGGGGDDTLIAASGILRAGQTIVPGGSGNTLELQGAGLFNLAAPTTLSNIQTVDVQGASSGQSQLIWLRSGMDLALNVQDSANITIFGSSHTDTVNLGSGNAVVYLGSDGETVNGGSGSATFVVTAATSGATITAGSLQSVLKVQGGGSVTMGAGITGMQSAYLDNCASYTFAANATAGMAIFAGTGDDTITVGDASQIVIASTGTLLMEAAATEAGVQVRGAAGGLSNDTLEITSGGTFALNASTDNVTVKLDSASTLTLNHMAFIYAEGSAGNDVIRAGAAGQILSGGAGTNTLDDVGHYGVTFEDTVANFAGDTLADFTHLDTIDVVGLNSGSASVQSYVGTPSAGTLNLTDGTNSVGIKLTGTISGGTFYVIGSDGHGGTLFGYT